MKITFFKSPAAFRRWLERNHQEVLEFWVGFHKQDSGKGGMTYAEAVEEALCFGWIDGIVKRVDEHSYMHRFTPRRARSIWSLINIRHAERLREQGRMMPPGLRTFAARTKERSGIYSFENRPRTLDAAHEKKFKTNKKAWEFFQAQPPGYRRTACWWVVSAKKEETRERRLRTLVEDSANGRRLAQLTSPGKRR